MKFSRILSILLPIHTHLPLLNAHRLCLYYVLFTIISLLSFETIQAQSTTIISGNKDICQGDSTTLTVVGNFTTYRWSNGSITNAIVVKSSGLYTVTATDSRATPRVDSIFVSVHNPTPFIEGTPFICFGRSTTLSIQGNYRSIQWSTGEQRNRIFANTEGIYTVNVVDSFGCIASAQTTVRDGSKSYNSLPDSVKICQGDSLLLDATTPFAISYYWNTDDTTATIWARDSGRYNVIVSSGQCVNYDTIQVLVLPPPMVNLGSDTAICKGDTLILKAEKSELYSYKWTDGSTKPTLNATNEGIYGVEVMFGRCRASDSIDIVFFNKEAGKIIDTVSCTNQLRLAPDLRGVKTYKWSNGSADTAITVTKPSSYQVLMSNGKCVVSWFNNVVFKTKPIVNLGRDTVICQDLKKGSILLKAGEQSSASFGWQDGSNKPTFEVKKTGSYSVYAENECGNATGVVFIDMKNCYEIYVPTAFTPNNDGQNEILQVYPNANIKKILRFNIFDRWGNMVFNAANFMQDDAAKFAWDGRFNGKTLNPSVFVYFIEFETVDGHSLIQKGDVTLVR